LVACAFAWRELNTAERTQAQTMLKATREHGEALTEERTRNAAVVHTLSLRIDDARKVIEKQRVVTARQQQQISGLKDGSGLSEGRGRVPREDHLVAARNPP
jgi:hypothetical protein